MFQVTLPRWCGKIQNIWELPNQGRREEKSLLWQITIHQETLSDNTKTMFSKPNKILWGSIWHGRLKYGQHTSGVRVVHGYGFKSLKDKNKYFLTRD